MSALAKLCRRPSNAAYLRRLRRERARDEAVEAFWDTLQGTWLARLFDRRPALAELVDEALAKCLAVRDAGDA